MKKFVLPILAALGLSAVGANSQAPFTEPTSLNAQAEEAASNAVTFFSAHGYQLDFTLDSLKEVDRLFDEQVPNGHFKAGGLFEEHKGDKLNALSCYVGQVLRKKLGGDWVDGNVVLKEIGRGWLVDSAHPDSPLNWALKYGDGKFLWPPSKLLKRLQNGSEDGLFFYGQVAVADLPKSN